MGLVPVTPKTYYSNLIYEFYVNEAKRSSYYKKDIQNGDFETNDSLDAPEEDHMGSGQQAQAPSSQQSQKTAPAQAKPQPQTQNNVPAGRQIHLQDRKLRRRLLQSLRHHPVVIRRIIPIRLQFLMMAARSPIHSFRGRTGLPDGETSKGKLKIRVNHWATPFGNSITEDPRLFVLMEKKRRI